MEQNKNKKVIIIGAGFSGLAAASYLAKAGYEVTILEKNTQAGGRARQLKRDGFTFDIGPTFYWMPDVFESFFKDFDTQVSDYYALDKLDPAYQVYFGQNDSVLIGDSIKKISNTFDAVEPGSAKKLGKFLSNAKSNYEIAMQELVYQPGESIFEIITPATAMKLGLFFKSVKTQISQYISNKKLQKILEFPVLFLGAKPSNTPAFYNFMNYADFELGTWHPKGGMYKVIEAMVQLAQSLGVKITTDISVNSIEVNNNIATKVLTNKGVFECDILLSSADYAHTETLLPEVNRQYSRRYWERKTFAPSALLFYVAFDKKLNNLSHHTLFFDSDFEEHARTIYDDASWPEDPLFYASFPSITDETCAPEGHEAGIFLMPIAPGLKENKEVRKKYFDLILQRLEFITGQKVSDNILFYESYGVDDFIKDYNSYKGNAYGLANTLMQTHILRPRMKSKKVKNLYFTGQLTIPGPGIPPSLISGKIVSELIQKYHERAI